MVKSTIVKFANHIGETGLFRAFFSQCVPVFMLHRITTDQTQIPGAVHEDTLRRYLQYLADREFKILTMVELWQFIAEQRAIPSKSVMFTIDDGFFDHHDAAAKVFDEFGFALNFFVITEFLEQRLWPWDDQVAYAMEESSLAQVTLVLPSGEEFELKLGEHPCRETIRDFRNRLKSCDQSKVYQWLALELFPKLGVEFPDTVPRRYRPMSWDDARALSAAGHGVYPHTCTHRILSSLPAEEREKEIVDSISCVQRELGESPKVFAYPTGRAYDFGSPDVAVLKELGIDMAFSTVADYVRSAPTTDFYALPRFSLPDTMNDFVQIVNRFEAVKDRLFKH